MGFFSRLTTRLGLTKSHGERHPIRIFLLEDDERRCDWFAKRFKGDQLDVVCEIDEAKELLKTRTYDSIFLDHDLKPEHYGSTTNDDARTGYAIAHFLNSNARPLLWCTASTPTARCAWLKSCGAPAATPTTFRFTFLKIV
jgi:hypothetical protein